MEILIDKTLKHFYMLWESLILCKHENILLYLTFKENTISKLLKYRQITEIPTNKGVNSYKLKFSKIVKNVNKADTTNTISFCTIPYGTLKHHLN